MLFFTFRDSAADIGRPLIEFGPVDIAALRDQLSQETSDLWSLDQASREGLAQGRPGGAAYYYNFKPNFIRLLPLAQAEATGRIGVWRNIARALFDAVDRLVTREIAPLFPDCDILGVQLAELPPGETIAPHRDSGILALIHRLHGPISTNKAVDFTIADEPFSLHEGVLYELNNVVEHSVRNGGDTPRIHLLVDMIPHAVARASYYDNAGELAAALLKTGKKIAADRVVRSDG